MSQSGSPTSSFDPDADWPIEANTDEAATLPSAEQGAGQQQHALTIQTQSPTGSPKNAATATPAGGVGNVSNSASVSYHTTNININTAAGGDSNPSPSPLNPLALTSFLPSPLSPTDGNGGGLGLMSNFQTHAMSTVQSLAASFGHLATVLQKDQAHATREEDATRKKLNVLQNSIGSLSIQNKELSNLIVRTDEKAGLQIRELNERLNQLQNHLIVGLNAAGVTTTSTDFQPQHTRLDSKVGSITSGGVNSRPNSSLDMTMPRSTTPSALTATAPSTSLALPLSASFSSSPSSSSDPILDRLTRLENELTYHRQRADRNESRLMDYFTKLQQHLRKTQVATVSLVTHVAENPTIVQGEHGRESLTHAFDLIQVPVFEMLQEEKEMRMMMMMNDQQQAPSTSSSIHIPTGLPQPSTSVAPPSSSSTLHVPSFSGGSSTYAMTTPPRLTSSQHPSDISFTPRSALAAEQLRLDQVIENAAAAAVAAQQRKKEPLLSAEALAATAASHAAQIAAKQAQDILASIKFMQENGQFSYVSSSSNPQNTLQDAVFDDDSHKSTSTGGGGVGGTTSSITSHLTIKKLSDRVTSCEKTLWSLESTISSLSNNLTDLARKESNSKEQAMYGLKNLGNDFTNILTQFQALSRQFQAQHKVLDGRITNYRDEFDLAMRHSIDALTILEKHLDKKADMKLVLDKVSRSEYQAQVKQLKKFDEDILNRSVNRDEYRLQLNEIREVMSEDQRERLQNLTRMANEVSKLCNDLDAKASKSDLIDIVNTLNALPKVHEEVDLLKSYVHTELEQRTNEILNITIDRKQLKRSLQRLLKSLQDEVSSATLPVNCDTCALRTGVHSGTNCLSCAQQMKLNARLATYTATSGRTPSPSSSSSATEDGRDGTPFEILSSRGGGFMVTTSTSSSIGPSPPGTSSGQRRPNSRQVLQQGSRPSTSGSTGAHLGVGVVAVRPNTSGNGQQRPPFAKTIVLPPAHGASPVTVDHFPIPSTLPAGGGGVVAPLGSGTGLPPTPLSSRSEIGSDGKVYSSRGTRTHRLVANTTKSRARAEEEGEWSSQEQKDTTSEDGGIGSIGWNKRLQAQLGSQSARTR